MTPILELDATGTLHVPSSLLTDGIFRDIPLDQSRRLS